MDFDQYAGNYREIINQVSRASGEQFEYFIQLRISLMAARLAGRGESGAGLKILDFGCGTGATELFLQERFPQAAVFGTDVSAESIRVACSRELAGVEFVCSDSTALPFPDDYFDVIYSNGTMHHIPPSERPAVLQEIYRTCKKGGSVFIFENNPANPLMMRAMRNNPFDRDAQVVPPAHLKELVEESGFSTRQTCYYFFFPRVLRFLRFLDRHLGWLPVGAQYFNWSTKQGLS
ncbi:MAG TPA: class I SAM-dependent methyltransferase [Geomonas sp.]|nr:class I SAM-dependent methyltransferase [Geomonas sp.]